ncbi:MAG: hypothetical protein ACK5CE_15955 [Actinomycetes bacterium]
MIRRASRIFEGLVVGVGINPEKQSLFSLEDRVGLVRVVLAGEVEAPHRAGGDRPGHGHRQRQQRNRARERGRCGGEHDDGEQRAHGDHRGGHAEQLVEAAVAPPPPVEAEQHTEHALGHHGDRGGPDHARGVDRLDAHVVAQPGGDRHRDRPDEGVDRVLVRRARPATEGRVVRRAGSDHSGDH